MNPLSLLSIIIAVISCIVSLLVYWDSCDSTKKNRERYRVMTNISITSLYLFNKTKNIAGVQLSEAVVDDYFYLSMRDQSRELYNLVQDAMRLGLITIFVPISIKNSLDLHTALCDSLLETSTKKNADPREWTKMHLLMGLIRLLDICSKSKDVEEGIKVEVRNALESAGNLVETSWTYLSDPLL